MNQPGRAKKIGENEARLQRSCYSHFGRTGGIPADRNTLMAYCHKVANPRFGTQPYYGTQFGLLVFSVYCWAFAAQEGRLSGELPRRSRSHGCDCE
jgi:hypothetical protein